MNPIASIISRNWTFYDSLAFKTSLILARCQTVYTNAMACNQKVFLFTDAKLFEEAFDFHTNGKKLAAIYRTLSKDAKQNYVFSTFTSKAIPNKHFDKDII